MAVILRLEAGFLVVRAGATMNMSELEALECVEAVENRKRSRIILDLLPVLSISTSALRILALSARVLSGAGDGKVSVVCSREMALFFEKYGLNRIFDCRQTVAEITGVQTPPTRASMSDFIRIALQAVTVTLKVSANTPCRSVKSYLRGKGPAPASDIAAIASISSKAFNGALTLGFPTATYLPLMSRMLGTQYGSMVPEISDGVCEILNIVLGQARASLNEKGYGIKSVIPTSVTGKNVSFLPANAKASIIIPYQTDVGEFFLELTTTDFPLGADRNV